MNRSFIVPSLIASLSLLSACSGDACADACSSTTDVPSDDTQLDANGECASSCDSGDSAIPEVSWTLVVNASFLGTSEPAEVVVDGAQVGSTGDSITVTGKDSFTVSVGDPAQTSGDGIPLHALGTSWSETTWSGGTIIAPPVTVDTTIPVPEEQADTVQIDPDTLTVTMTVPMNLYASGMWTCDTGHSTGTGDITYTSGSLVFLEKIGDEIVTGITLADINTPDDLTGEFLSQTVATMTFIAPDGSGSSNYFCWAGDEEDDPR